MNDNSSSSSSPSEEAYLFAMRLATAPVLPSALKCAMELDLLELIRKAGPGGSVSSADLAAGIAATNPTADAMLDRILRLLAAGGILFCSLRELPAGGEERRYSLAPVCEFLTRNDDGVSVAPLFLMNHDKVFMETWYHLKDAVVEGGIPFNKAHGMSAFEYPAKDPRFNQVFNQGMSQQSTLLMKKIVEVYTGFEGLQSLVDVGGGTGASLRMILSKYPSIKAINFDLSHVIQDAPSHPVDLSRLERRPLLENPKNCHESLPENGKVIIAERILSDIPNADLSSSLAFTVDVMMLAFNPGGKERTEMEFHALAKESGFKEFRKVCSAFGIWIMELYK